MFLIAVSTVDRAALCRLEWDFTFLATVRADGFMHLSGSAIETAPISITHFLHSYYFSYTKKIVEPILLGYQTASYKTRF